MPSSGCGQREPEDGATEDQPDERSRLTIRLASLPEAAAQPPQPDSSPLASLRAALPPARPGQTADTIDHWAEVRQTEDRSR